MDPLHPLVPITPPPPATPIYGRVERIERDGQRQPGPDWEQEESEEHSKEQPAEEQYEDDYDPNWEDPAAVEPYGPDGTPHDATHQNDAIAIDLSAEKAWDPRTHAERRSRPRDQDQGIDPDTGHIDISA